MPKTKSRSLTRTEGSKDSTFCGDAQDKIAIANSTEGSKDNTFCGDAQDKIGLFEYNCFFPLFLSFAFIYLKRKERKEKSGEHAVKARINATG